MDAALPYADEITHFRLGGFNLPLQPGESVRLIRAFNVLRQYEEKDFAPAYERLAEYVLPGGLMIGGTSNPFGSIWAANLVRKQESGWKFEALVFSSSFRMGFDITDFQAVLPKNYIHHVIQVNPFTISLKRENVPPQRHLQRRCLDRNNGLPLRWKVLRQKGIK